MKCPAVYLLASQRKGALYVGVTSDLVRRSWQHRSKAIDGFTKQYGVHRLLWFEQHEIDGGGDPAREADQEMESGVEDRADRKGKPWMEGLVE